MAGAVSLEYSSKELESFIKKFIKETEYDTASAISYVSREVAMRTIARTPIGKTHRAVAGWSAVAHGLNLSVPSSRFSEGGDSSYSEHLTGKNPYIEFSNNVPYIIYLEYGWSAQAPLGMLRISIAEVQSSGKLPATLSRRYEARWYNTPGAERYEEQESIMARGLSAVKMKVPSRRSIAAHLSAELRQRRSKHKSSAVLTKIQKKFSGS